MHGWNSVLRRAQDLTDHSERLLDLRRPDDERRCQPQHLGAGGEDEEPTLPAGVHNRSDGPVERHAEEETATPYLEHARQGSEPAGELLAANPHVGRSSSSTASTVAHAAAQTTGLPPKVEP